MSAAFGFSLRLFLCFVAARFLLQAVGLEDRTYLIGLTILLLINIYWFSYLVFRERRAAPAGAGREPLKTGTGSPEGREPPAKPPDAGD